MAFLTKYILLLFTLLASIVQANPFAISEQEINHYLSHNLSQKFRLQDSVGIPHLLQLDYHLHQLSTKIGQTEEKRVEITGVIDGLLNLKGKQYQVSLNLNIDALPYYEAETGSLFLKNLRLTHWDIVPEKYQTRLQPFVTPVIEHFAKIVDSTPIYTLDESKIKEALIKKLAKQIVVEKGYLRLETAFF